ncbi:MAG: serine hydrolase [Burkholderiales bacterium]|nr:serine hydrolase [Burkholderiales bacterium]
MRAGEERQLHRLEKIVAAAALAAVLALAVGFAQAREPRAEPDRLALRASAALVQDATSGETLYAKNDSAVVPIASLTKLMTALVIVESGVDLAQRVVISEEDFDTLKGTRSRLAAGSVFTREELLLLALMASENRAAAALARTFPGGSAAFVAQMNARARLLGMADTRFVDASGLSPANVSSAHDLARLAAAAYAHPIIREYSTRERAVVQVFGRPQEFRNTNALVRSGQWDIGLSKTGYIAEAGRCLVMRVRMASRDLVVVLLDSWGKHARAADAARIRRWLETSAARAPRG